MSRADAQVSMSSPDERGRTKSPPRIGRYELLVRIGKGGMASVYLARVRGEGGFTRLYALKVLHPHLSEHQEFVDMLMDEAKIASRLHHPNVVSTVDVGRDGKRYFLVMDYVEGVALDRLLRRSPDRRPPELIVPVAIDALRGLHAAHQLRDERGQPLNLVHRDVTPGNLIVGADGSGRIADFGVAKARARITKTNPGIVKGKAGYIAPEVVLGRDIDGRADVFSMGVLLWNTLTGESLFDTDDLASTLTSLMNKEVPPPSEVGCMPPAIFDAPILGALHREPGYRHDDALEMAQALEDAMALHGQRVERESIGRWVLDTFGEQLEKRRRYAAASDDTPSWDPDGVEPPSTSALVRKDPTGRIFTAMPEARPDVLDDPFEDEGLAPSSPAGPPSPSSPPEGAAGDDDPTVVPEPPPAARSSAPPAATPGASSARAAVPEAAPSEPEPRRSAAPWIALAGSVLLLLAGGAGGWWWWSGREDPAIEARPIEEPALEEASAPAAPEIDLSRDVLGREEPPAPAEGTPRRGAPRGERTGATRRDGPPAARETSEAPGAAAAP
ncbi:MAG TPA: protein kinase, partial [Sandaracinaceae bacterium LLY-WYZ-13_1]|nr:protein kinase [Sandaracinaceae bacterium LLY-WYZ-13_1]